MANQEHVRILSEGSEAWNQWRAEHKDVQPDLSGARLGLMSLGWADREGAQLRRAYIWRGDLRETDLSRADLRLADLREVNLRGANLGLADLSGADLRWTDLAGANLEGTHLVLANLSRADLHGANLSQAQTDLTVFGDVDLSEALALETVVHRGPSTIGIDTIYRSQGRIPEASLRGAGVPDEFITYMRSLAGRSIEYYSCFISYSSKDQAFAEWLHADLQAKGVRCWFVPEDIKIGDRFRQRIDEAIRVHDKLLLILSEHSIKSDWVASEVEAAFEKERRHVGQSILFPIRLDDAVMDADQAWAADIRRTRHIRDFTRWREHDAYAAASSRLMRDLRAAEG